jgi:phospholipase C
VRVPGSKALQTIGSLLGLLLAIGCQEVLQPPSTLAVDSAPATCSQMHRDVSKWQGVEIADCGPDVTGLVELTPIGNDWLLARQRFAPLDSLWSLTPDGAAGDAPGSVDQVMGAATAGFTLLPGSPPRVLVYDPRQSQWNLYVTQDATVNGTIFSSGGQGQWPPGYWPANQNGGPWDHQFVGLEDGQLLDRDLGDGSARIWSVVSGSSDTIPSQLVPSESLVAGPQDHFRRGHRLVHLGPNRLLEWLPRPCAGRASPSEPCAGSDFTVWSYSLDSGDSAAPLTFQIVSSGFWPDVGDESDVLADAQHLFVWTRDTGRLRAYAIDPTFADPLGVPPVADPSPNALLASQDWKPPTTSPAIKHLVIVLQDGRSFDSYFGRYCQGAPGLGAPLPCTSGAACCEAIPTEIPGAVSCVDPESDTSYQPANSPECLRTKIDNGAMDEFAVPHPPAVCGDPRDFACADAGGIATYQRLAATGALADRFFQTYAFVDRPAADTGPDPVVENLLYLVSSRFAAYPPSLIDTPLLTKELVRLQVPWAIYAGPVNLPLLKAFGVPIFYDPDWFPYRSLDGGEFEHDIAVGVLPAVAVVLPDRGDPLRSEAPGRPFDPGIAYVDSLINTIAMSPYQSDTLVLVTHLTAGGFYDHVPPPPPPPVNVDAFGGSAALANKVFYGPRVPLLAVGKFARSNTISHDPLEISSITRFVEWNWLHGSALKRDRQTDDLRRYRDTAVFNLGSLIDGTAAGIDVPSGSN